MEILEQIECCWYQNRDTGIWEKGLLLNEGSLGIIDRFGRKLTDEPIQWIRSHEFSLRIMPFLLERRDLLFRTISSPDFLSEGVISDESTENAEENQEEIQEEEKIEDVISQKKQTLDPVDEKSPSIRLKKTLLNKADK